MSHLTCFKVKVKTTDHGKDSTHGSQPKQYIRCEDGYLYVSAPSFSHIEKIVYLRIAIRTMSVHMMKVFLKSNNYRVLNFTLKKQKKLPIPLILSS